MKPIQTLLFDFGGVLVDLRREDCVQRFARLGFDITPYLGAYAQQGFVGQLENGDLTQEQFCQHIRQQAGRPELTDEEIVGAWNAYIPHIPTERLDMLRRIARHYRLCLLSNTNAIHWQLAERQLFRHPDAGDLLTLFAQKFLSFRLHMQKPSPRIYRHVLSQLSCAPAEALFLDDSPTNVQAAQAAGLPARLAPAGGQWLSYFTDDGLLLPHEA